LYCKNAESGCNKIFPYLGLRGPSFFFRRIERICVEDGSNKFVGDLNLRRPCIAKTQKMIIFLYLGLRRPSFLMRIERIRVEEGSDEFVGDLNLRRPCIAKMIVIREDMPELRSGW
jgi:hypothetical protein